MKFYALILLCLIFVFPVNADDGMWLPHQLGLLNLENQGLKLKPEEMFREDGTGLMSAIVYLGGGTGEFVSKNGLILTNHHVAYRALQRSSTPEKNYLKDGFVAWKYQEEISVPEYYADVLISYEEVTDQIWSAVAENMNFREMHEAIELQKKKMISEVEKEAPDRRCKIVDMYSGNKYYLFKFKRLNDVRMVMAPPKSLGNFGADIDNWTWPRHTCDFTFLRAYVSKDNIGVPYAESNVPYQPKSVLKISTAGVKQGDLSFVMGYPGKTYRNYTLAEMQKAIRTMQRSITLRENQIAFLEKAGAKDEKIALLYASRLKGLNNGLKNYKAKLEGFEKAGVIDIKENMEADFQNWVDADAKRKTQFATVIADVEKYVVETEPDYRKYFLVSTMLSSRYGVVLPMLAHTIIRIVNERAKPDMERDPKYQEREMDRLMIRLQRAERTYDFNTDRDFLKYFLNNLKSFPQSEIPQALKDILVEAETNGVAQYVDAMYAQTTLANADKRLQMTRLTPEQLVELDDPLINFTLKIESFLQTYRENEKTDKMRLKELKRKYLSAMLQLRNNRLAPDANSTLRFTYGIINGYVPRDAVYYQPVTTLTGVIEKDTGTFPFNVPQKIKELYQNKDFGGYADPEHNDIVTCFLNETNVTGGNSGSPTLNAKGEQIGIIFDMTYESVTGDYYVIPELQRTISVDIRYVLFVTGKFSGAQHIIQELNVN